MSDVLERWRADPISFIETVLHDPETGAPFKLLDAERAFLQHAFLTDDDGRLLYQEQLFGAPKKTGKTGFAGLHVLTTVLLFGGRFAEGYALANDEEQAQSRVFQAIKRIVEASPLLMREAKITADKIVFPAFHNATIATLTTNYASVAGSNPTISAFDELWGYTSERSHRLWDEMVPPPTRKIACRLTTTYAGFEGQSTLLEALYKRGLQQPLIGKDLRAGDGMLMFWTHDCIAPWQSESWIAEMRRSLRPNQFLRMIENRFVSGETTFIDMSKWDACVVPGLGAPVENRLLPLYVGVDASVKHDSTAIVGVTYDTKAKLVRLIFHRVFQPTPEQPLDFALVEATLLDLSRRFQMRKCLCDPFQLASTMQRLAQQGLPIEEYPQSVPNLTAASQNLFELIQSLSLVCYPDAAMRLAVSRAIALETPRGWRISKEKQAHKIDVVIALMLACHAAIVAQSEPFFDNSFGWVSGPAEPDDPYNTKAWQGLRNALYLGSGGMTRLW